MFAVFLTGTLTVFDTEITAWMQPELHEITSDTGQYGESAYGLAQLNLPLARNDRGSIDRSLLLVKLQEKRTFSGQTIDPATGRLVIFRDTQGGDFFYHLSHYGLLFGWPGAWLVGIAAIVMLITLATDVCDSRWTYKDMVMVRLRPFPRAWLDAHNLTGVLVIPFHLMIIVTGLAMFWSIYMPVDIPFLRESEGILPLLSILHFAQFGGRPMRWLYFIMGLAATVMIATGLVLWTTKRQRTQAGRSSQTGYRIVEILNVATVAGLPVGVAAFFWANRLLPMALTERSLWEIRCFFIVWGLCLIPSLLSRGSIKAWRDQLYGSACLLGFLPLLNGLTTNSHLLTTVPKAQWAIAGVDLTRLTVGALLGWTARRVGERALRHHE